MQSLHSTSLGASEGIATFVFVLGDELRCVGSTIARLDVENWTPPRLLAIKDLLCFAQCDVYIINYNLDRVKKIA